MKRKDFFRTATLATAGIIGLGRVASAAEYVSKQKVKPIFLIETDIAGYQYYEGEKIENLIESKEKIELRLQENNKYDQNAIEIFYKGIKLGYIPRDENTIPANLIRQNKELYAEFKSLNPENETWNRMIIKVFMK
jgi:hypothetical protein